MRLDGWGRRFDDTVTAEEREQYQSRLLECFTTPAAAASLSGVEVLDVGRNDLGTHVIALLLLCMPNLKEFRISTTPAGDGMAAWLVSLLYRGARHLRSLYAPWHIINFEAAALLGALPALERIDVMWCSFTPDNDAQQAASLAGLRPERFTDITVRSDDCGSLLPPSGAVDFSRLVELRGAALSCQQAQALAQGAPLLRSLDCAPKGDWTGLVHALNAVFAHVAHASFWWYGAGFSGRVRLHQLVPSLQRLVLYPRQEDFGQRESAAVSFAGLTALQTLVFHTGVESIPRLQSDWAHLSSLPLPRELACPVALADSERLARMVDLQVLEASLLAAPLGAATAYDLGNVLIAVADALPQLGTLQLSTLEDTKLVASAATVAQFCAQAMCIAAPGH